MWIYWIVVSDTHVSSMYYVLDICSRSCFHNLYVIISYANNVDVHVHPTLSHQRGFILFCSVDYVYDHVYCNCYA